MSIKNINQLILQVENFLECWKQFNKYLNMARSKTFTPEDEGQFLDVKSVIAQELELILASIESGAPGKDDMHNLLSSAPSIRFVSEMAESSQRGLENQWHKLFISWQSILGQLKVQQRQNQSRSFWQRLFGTANT
jgi:hypothetical protein